MLNLSKAIINYGNKLNSVKLNLFNFKNVISHQQKQIKRHMDTGYFILMPEIPADTAETNAIMRNDEIPSFNEIDPKKVQTGIQKLAVTFDSGREDLMSSFETDNNTPVTFETVFAPLEALQVPLDTAIKTSMHLALLYPNSSYHSGFSRVDDIFHRKINEKYTNETFYKLLKNLESNKHLLNEGQKRLLEFSLRKCVKYGLSLNKVDAEKCADLNYKIHGENMKFRERLKMGNRKFGITISSELPMNDVPRDIRLLIANDRNNPDKGPWTVYPDQVVYEGLMKYSGNRNLRKAVYEAFYSRASYVKEQLQSNNSEVIIDLVKYRKSQAKLFGFKNYADLAIENQAALKLENVVSLFEKIRTNLRPVVDEDLAKLQKFSANHGNLTAFENYDLDYWKTRHTTHYFKTDSTSINQYFPFEKVLSGLFELTKDLFNVTFEKDDSQNDKLWSEDVHVYKCLDENNKHISTLIVDPYLRPKKTNGIWCSSGRASSQITETKPLVYLNLNVRNSGPSSTLSFLQLKKIFSEFGQAIELLLSQTEWIEFSPPQRFELDASDLTRKLFERLVYQPDVIKYVSAHVNSGEPMPADVLKRLENADSNFKSFYIMKQTFLSAFDIECHISDNFWMDTMHEVWKKFMPTKLASNDYRPCQFMAIFGENHACLYYTTIWSEMLATDLFDGFKDIGFANKAKLGEVGRKYRDTFLKNGSSVHPNELFRQFRGRNPSMDPFIKSYLPKNKK